MGQLDQMDPTKTDTAKTFPRVAGKIMTTTQTNRRKNAGRDAKISATTLVESRLPTKA